MKFTLILLLLCPLNSTAQTDPYYQTSNLYHARASHIACQSIDRAIEEISKKSEEQIKTEISEAVEFSEDTDVFHDLKKIQNQKKSKEKIIQGLESICKTATVTL
jgi:hypothetical protein